MTTFQILLSGIIGAEVPVVHCAYIFAAFVLFGLYAVVILVRGAFHK